MLCVDHSDASFQWWQSRESQKVLREGAFPDRHSAQLLKPGSRLWNRSGCHSRRGCSLRIWLLEQQRRGIEPASAQTARHDHPECSAMRPSHREKTARH